MDKCHADNLENHFVILREGPTFRINGSFGAWEKRIDINSSKAKTKFCVSLHYNADNSYLFVNGKEIYKFKANNGNINFPSRFCSWSMSNKVDYVKSEEVSFKGNVYHFSVDYGADYQSNILNIQQWLKILYKMFRLNKKSIYCSII